MTYAKKSQIVALGAGLLFSLVSASASADEIQACLDKLALTKTAISATNNVATPSNMNVTFKRASENELGARCDERGDLNGVKRALRLQLARCSTLKKNDKPTFKLACREFRRDEWCRESNQQLLDIANASPNFSAFLDRIRSSFDWYKSSGMNRPTSDRMFEVGETQFTSYYSPVIKASRVKTAKFRYPIYKQPAELVQIDDSSPSNCGISTLTHQPRKWCRKGPNNTYSLFYTRAEIDGGALSGRGLEIAYLEDPLEIDFIMVEGSATLEIDHADGTKEFVHANYAAKNGRTLQMLGRVVKCDGGQKADYTSMEGLKNYLKAKSPERLRQLINYDQSYIFFRELKDGPMGSEEVPVTPMHSLAVDRSIIPPGSGVLFDFQKTKARSNVSCPRLSSFASAQDTGGVIKQAHVDWYVGEGDKAAELSGDINNPGSIFVAMPKGAGRPIPNCQ